MRPKTPASKTLLESSQAISSLYRKALVTILSFSFLMMLLQIFIGDTALAYVPTILFGIWLLLGPVVLLVWGALRLYAKRIKKREAERNAQLQQARQIALFRAAEDAREAAREKETAAQPAANVGEDAHSLPIPAKKTEAPAADALPEIIPTVNDGWREKALLGRAKADALEGVKPDVHPFNWQERLIDHAQKYNRFREDDIELMRKEVKTDTHIFRMRESIGYYYVDIQRPSQDGVFTRVGWGPLSAQNVLRAACPDHPEVIARVLAAVPEERREDMQHALNDMLDEDAAVVTGVARSWSDPLYLSRETVVLFRNDHCIEVRFHTEQNPTPRNPDPRKMHLQRWLSIPWADLQPCSENTCLRLFREQNPLSDPWWISKLAQNDDFLALFKQPE